MGIDPDWDIDAFMKASNLKGKQQSIVTDYILRMLGLEVPGPALLMYPSAGLAFTRCLHCLRTRLQVCEETIVGDQLVRGISGGQKKRVTTGLQVC